MEILKKKIEEYRYLNDFNGKYIRCEQIYEWLREFQERQQKKVDNHKALKDQYRKLNEFHVRQAHEIEELKAELVRWKRLSADHEHMKKSLDKEIENSLFWQQKHDNLKNELTEVDEMKKKCFTAARLSCEIHELKAQLSRVPSYYQKSSESPWIEVDYPPSDDQNVLVYNNVSKVFPIIAVYDAEDKSFYGLHLQSTFPLDVTHWCNIAELPDNS